MQNIIKFYFIFLYTTFIFFRLINQKPCKNMQTNIFLIFPLFLACLTHQLRIFYAEISYIIAFLILWIFLSIVTTKPRITFVTATISFGISFCIGAASSAFALLIMSPFYYKHQPFPYTLLAILTAIIQSMLIILLFRKKRLKKGIYFLMSSTTLNLATIICILLLLFLVYRTATTSPTSLKIITLVFLLIMIPFLIHWWEFQTTKLYKQILLYQQLDSLRTELSEKNKLIIELTEQNEQMGRLIHQDNKMLPAMEQAVCEYLVTAENDIDALSSKSDTLVLEIQNLSRYRKSALKETDIYDYKKYDTKISSLNILLNLYSKRSVEEHVIFTVNNAVDLQTFIPELITNTDFTHLLSNLLDNASIATASVTKPMIQLQFYVSKGNFIVEVADNGIPFEVTSLINFGIKQLTTHGDTGGSGVGLMEIWKHKTSCNASLHIEEYASANPFTKKISLIFNKKGKYTISTYRKAEISNMCNRLDLQVYEQMPEP